MELFRALGTLAEPPSSETARLAELLGLGAPPTPGRYERLFLFQLYPYASVYLGPEGQLGGEARDRIAGFWRALELAPPTEPDHLALMLGLYARLAELEAEADADGPRAGWRHARKAWLWEHLLSWLPVYLTKASLLGDDFYSGWARLLIETLLAEASELGPLDSLPLHLREAPELDDPRPEGGAAFVEQLLSPIRTGFIVVADDLQRAASELQLGLRAGERRFVLKALLGQDAASTLSWLGRHAAEAGRRYDDALAPVPAVAFWRARAQASAELLEKLAADADSARQPVDD